MSTDTILELLENGKWHYIKDIEKKTHFNSCDVETVTKFLASYNFVELDEKKQRVKSYPPICSFLKRIRQLEKEENQ